MNVSFCRALLRVNLDVLEMTAGRTAHADQIDVVECEHGTDAMLIAHVKRRGPRGDIRSGRRRPRRVRDALARPMTSIVLPNGRLLRDDELWARLLDDARPGAATR